MNPIRAIENRIFEDATEEQEKALRVDYHYGSPQSFWAAARSYNLVTEGEYERARLHYMARDTWYYRGD